MTSCVPTGEPPIPSRAAPETATPVASTGTALPSGAPSSRNWTVPDQSSNGAVPVDTCARNVTGWPATEGSAEEERWVTVAAFSLVSRKVALLAPAALAVARHGPALPLASRIGETAIPSAFVVALALVAVPLVKVAEAPPCGSAKVTVAPSTAKPSALTTFADSRCAKTEPTGACWASPAATVTFDG